MPDLEELNTRFYDKLDMVLIDCDEREFGRILWDEDVRGTPTFRIYRDGRCLSAFSGLEQDAVSGKLEQIA
ncbi:unnamed protein product [Oikopleura dioica]|uniref:Thioredoxin domain-containing protein n=1 Tax=Oikopleura dioica TaxID=34765 RepID=E4X6Z9_OIKDI|nr:unnamed protein product [Oikopleura dioica]